MGEIPAGAEICLPFFLLHLNTHVEVLSFRLQIARWPIFFAKVHTQPNIWAKSFIAAVLIYHLEFGRFETKWLRFKSFRYEAVKLHKNVDQYKYSLRVKMKNFLGEYSSFLKPNTLSTIRGTIYT